MLGGKLTCSQLVGEYLQVTLMTPTQPCCKQLAPVIRQDKTHVCGCSCLQSTEGR